MDVDTAKKKFYQSHSPEAYKVLQEALEAEQGSVLDAIAPVEATVATEDAEEDLEVEVGGLNPAVLYET